MGSRLSCLKPICSFCNNTKKEPERRQQRPLHKYDKKEHLFKNNKLTLQDYMLSSPRSSSLPVSSSKRVHPNPFFINDGASKERRLSDGHLHAQIEGGDDDKLKRKMDGNLLSKGERTKKKVSFRKPEIADVFILADSPISAHESANLQS